MTAFAFPGKCGSPDGGTNGSRGFTPQHGEHRKAAETHAGSAEELTAGLEDLMFED
jgi:hypothetical protein